MNLNESWQRSVFFSFSFQTLVVKRAKKAQAKSPSKKWNYQNISMKYEPAFNGNTNSLHILCYMAEIMTKLRWETLQQWYGLSRNDTL